MLPSQHDESPIRPAGDVGHHAGGEHAAVAPSAVRSRQVKQMQPLELIARTRARHWIALSLAILLLDYATGPFIQVPILFVLPVAMATASHGRRMGAGVALVLPLARLSFFARWNVTPSWAREWIDAGIDVVILVGLAMLIDQALHQRRQIRVLEGMLPICSFCKRIRDEGGEWRQLESFIAERSTARFSHTFCQECGREHYGELAD